MSFSPHGLSGFDGSGGPALASGCVSAGGAVIACVAAVVDVFLAIA